MTSGPVTARRPRLSVALLLPTVATASLRINQLLVLLVFSRLPDRGESSFTVAALGTMTAFAIASDVGSANFMLTRRTGVSRPMYLRALRFQIGMAILGANVGLLVVGLRAPDGTAVDTWAVVCAVAVSQVLDASLRAARAPLLHGGQDARYSRPELMLAAAKLVPVGLAFMTGRLEWLYLLPLLSLVVFARTVHDVGRGCPPGDRAPRGTHLAIVQFGLAGSLSALYSQLPLVVAAVALPLPQTAMLAIAYRVIQPMEILPGTLATQLLPRVRSHVRRPGRWWISFAGGGAVLTCVVLLSAGVVRDAFDAAEWNSVVFALVAAAFVPKSGNYALAAVLMGLGGIRARLVINAAVGATASVLCLALVGPFGIVGLASVSVACEVLLGVSLIVAVRRVRNEGLAQ